VLSRATIAKEEHLGKKAGGGAGSVLLYVSGSFCCHGRHKEMRAGKRKSWVSKTEITCGSERATRKEENSLGRRAKN